MLREMELQFTQKSQLKSINGQTHFWACYGYSKIETPNLDRLARQGVLFENAVAPAPLTAPSHACMMTGLYPTVHKVRNTGGFVLSPSDTTLAKLLQDQG